MPRVTPRTRGPQGRPWSRPSCPRTPRRPSLACRQGSSTTRTDEPCAAGAGTLSAASSFRTGRRRRRRQRQQHQQHVAGPGLLTKQFRHRAASLGPPHPAPALQPLSQPQPLHRQPLSRMALPPELPLTRAQSLHPTRRASTLHQRPITRSTSNRNRNRSSNRTLRRPRTHRLRETSRIGPRSWTTPVWPAACGLRSTLRAGTPPPLAVLGRPATKTRWKT
mmetsp:Transcript_3772/g.15671  ORF Transcript_3772/g.15671 Transcript_3772/m.15671 type:complete len:221 (+) Transcript_3772:112-774(+)